LRMVTLLTGACVLIASASASADQTCKAKAIQQKVAWEALLNFVKQCEFEVLIACANQTAKKPNSDALMESCRADMKRTGRQYLHRQGRL
jgi:hypothetical protein